MGDYAGVCVWVWVCSRAEVSACGCLVRVGVTLGKIFERVRVTEPARMEYLFSVREETQKREISAACTYWLKTDQ